LITHHDTFFHLSQVAIIHTLIQQFTLFKTSSKGKEKSHYSFSFIDISA